MMTSRCPRATCQYWQVTTRVCTCMTWLYRQNMTRLSPCRTSIGRLLMMGKGMQAVGEETTLCVEKQLEQQFEKLEFCHFGSEKGGKGVFN